MKKNRRLPPAWFKAGKNIARNGNADIFNPPILIQSKEHGKALYLTQTEKNYSYKEI